MNYVKGIKTVLAQASKILSQTLNIHIQNHLAEGSSKKMKSNFLYLLRRHSILLFLMYARLISVPFDMSSISLKIDLHPSSHSCYNSLR